MLEEEKEEYRREVVGVKEIRYGFYPLFIGLIVTPVFVPVLPVAIIISGAIMLWGLIIFRRNELTDDEKRQINLGLLFLILAFILSILAIDVYRTGVDKMDLSESTVKSARNMTLMERIDSSVTEYKEARTHLLLTPFVSSQAVLLIFISLALCIRKCLVRGRRLLYFVLLIAALITISVVVLCTLSMTSSNDMRKAETEKELGYAFRSAKDDAQEAVRTAGMLLPLMVIPLMVLHMEMVHLEDFLATRTLHRKRPLKDLPWDRPTPFSVSKPRPQVEFHADGEEFITEEEADEVEEDVVDEGEGEPRCPECDEPLRYVEAYDGWYCDECEEYREVPD